MSQTCPTCGQTFKRLGLHLSWGCKGRQDDDDARNSGHGGDRRSLTGRARQPNPDPVRLFFATHGAAGLAAEVVASYAWAHLDNVPRVAQDLWPLGMPRLIRGVWTPSAPSAGDLFEACITALATGQAFGPNESIDVKQILGRAFIQLDAPDENAPALVRNLALQPTQAALSLPSELVSPVGSYFPASRLQVDIAPKFSLLDLRMKQGLHIVVAGVATEQIWFMFPPTERNLNCMRHSTGFALTVPQLEGGIIATMTHSSKNRSVTNNENNGQPCEPHYLKVGDKSANNVGIFMPAGTIYASFATAGGYVCHVAHAGHGFPHRGADGAGCNGRGAEQDLESKRRQTGKRGCPFPNADTDGRMGQAKKKKKKKRANSLSETAPTNQSASPPPPQQPSQPPLPRKFRRNLPWLPTPDAESGAP